MSKLVVFIGKGIHNLVSNYGRWSIVQNYPMSFIFPEVENGHPLHADDYVKKTLDRVQQLLAKDLGDVLIITQSESLVSHIGSRIDQGTIKGGEDNTEIRLYKRDCSEHRTFWYNDRGYLTGGWPIGWFLHDDTGSFQDKDW